MKCLDCPLKCIGQTARTFTIRYKEHMQSIRNNNNNSGYSNHILNTGHTYGTINKTMDIIKKGKHLNTLEKYHIHKISKNNLHMNDVHNDTYPIFETLHDLYNRLQHTPLISLQIGGTAQYSHNQYTHCLESIGWE
jgi:hypothetical protein